MDKNAPLGMLETCATCGGKNEWTGKKRIGDEIAGLGDGPMERFQLAEVRCSACGRREWAQIGTTTES